VEALNSAKPLFAAAGGAASNQFNPIQFNSIHPGEEMLSSSSSDDIQTFKVAATVFQIPKKYELIRPIGSGAYGVVISALDTETGRKCAIKKVHRVFEDLIDAKRILREIKLLRQFEHENIINIVDILPPLGSLAAWEDLYIVNDLMETDLHRIIYSSQPLSIDHCQYFVYQILRALKYMHSAHVVHRDLKPSNLLLNGNCDLKICDLGLSRGIEGDDAELTEYVVTRWYRAPEIMLACQEYTEAIDVWSVGCIFGELLERRALFPGEDYIDQLRRIVAKLGKPAPDELDFVTSDKARRFILGLPEPPADSETDVNAMRSASASDGGGRGPTERKRRPPAAWRAANSHVDPLAVDLLERMLVFRPADRISVEEALRHPFMAQLHVESDEPKAGFAFDWAYEQAQDLSKQSLQRLVWEEMSLFHPECAALETPNEDWSWPGGNSGVARASQGVSRSPNRGTASACSIPATMSSSASASASASASSSSYQSQNAERDGNAPSPSYKDAPSIGRAPRTRYQRSRQDTDAVAPGKDNGHRKTRTSKYANEKEDYDTSGAKEVAAASQPKARRSRRTEETPPTSKP
jgi:mitogen-activated protein kinase 1/3